MERFVDRAEAGRFLASKLARYANRLDVVVLALPRGGVPVAYEVALVLDAPLDIFTVRKLGLPGYEELAMGAISSGGVRVLNEEVVNAHGVTPDVIERVTAAEKAELERREKLYRGGRAALPLDKRTVILVDDGLATGATMRAAAVAVRKRGPTAIVVAVPVAAPESCEAFRSEVDDTVCALTPERFGAVGAWYESFEQISEDEVRKLLDETDRRWKMPDVPAGRTRR